MDSISKLETQKMAEPNRFALALDTDDADIVTCHRHCLLCGLPAGIGGVFLPDRNKWDVPAGCYLAIPYSLCFRCARIPQNLLVSAIEGILSGDLVHD